MPPVGSHLLPGLTILHHPDLKRVGERVVLIGVSSGREELLSRGKPAFSQPGESVLRPLVDPYLSRRPIRLSPGAETGSIRLERCEAGPTLMADGEPVERAVDVSAERLDRGVVLLMANRIVLLLSRLDPVGAAGVPPPVSSAKAPPSSSCIGRSSGQPVWKSRSRCSSAARPVPARS